MNNELENVNKISEDIDEKIKTVEGTMMETPEKELWRSSRTKNPKTFLDRSNSGQSYDKIPAKVFMAIMDKCLHQFYQFYYNKGKKKFGDKAIDETTKELK